MRCAVCLILLLASSRPASSGPEDSKVYGHRGGEARTERLRWSDPDHWRRREVWGNRLATFEARWRDGQRWFELDATVSGDDDVMVLHHSRIGDQDVWGVPTQDLVDRGWSRLSDVLSMFERLQREAGDRAELLIELKAGVSTDHTTDFGQDGVGPAGVRLLERAVPILRQRLSSGWRPHQLRVVGFNHALVLAARAREPRLEVMLSYAKEHAGLTEADMRRPWRRARAVRRRFRAWLDEAQGAGAVGILLDRRLALGVLRRDARARGLRVVAWTAFGDREPTARLLRGGVDLISDRPLAARALQRRMRERREGMRQAIRPLARQRR